MWGDCVGSRLEEMEEPPCPSFPRPEVMFTKQLCGRRLRTTHRVCPAGERCACTVGFSTRHLATPQTRHDFPGLSSLLKRLAPLCWPSPLPSWEGDPAAPLGISWRGDRSRRAGTEAARPPAQQQVSARRVPTSGLRREAPGPSRRERRVLKVRSRFSEEG